MAKNTIKDLLESAESTKIDFSEEIVKNIASPVIIREIKNFAKASSNALQPRMSDFIAILEDRLNQFGLTLGDMDPYDNDESESGKEDFVVFCYRTGEPIKNFFLSLMYEKVAPIHTKYVYQVQDHRVTLKVNEIDPSEFEGMLSSNQVTVDGGSDEFNGDNLTGQDDYSELDETVFKRKREMDKDDKPNKSVPLRYQIEQEKRKREKNTVKEMIEKSESLEEAIKIKQSGKRFQVNAGNDGVFSVEFYGNSALIKVGERAGADSKSIEIKGNDLNKLIEGLSEFLLDNA